MAHRIREGMREAHLPEPMGGEGKFVEADETYVGGKAKNRAYAKTLPSHEAVMSLVERGGKVRSRHVADVTAKTLKPILVEAIAKDSHFRTDQAPVYTEIGAGFASHATVNHSIKEYVRGDAHTNTVEGYFSIFKRGIYGVYHHVSAEHLKRYLGEFDFRYNHRIALGFDDETRAAIAIKGIAGKRLTYRQPRGAQQAKASDPQSGTIARASRSVLMACAARWLIRLARPSGAYGVLIRDPCGSLSDDIKSGVFCSRLEIGGTHKMRQ